MTADIKSRQMIGIFGIALLVIYIIMGFLSPVFGKIVSRFGIILMAPFVNFLTLYSLIPVYFNWITGEFFGEELFTTRTSGVKNGFMGLWVATDWFRTTYVDYPESQNPVMFVIKFFFSSIVFLYGFFVIKASLQNKAIVQIIGRIREISYFAIMFTTIIYEVVPVDATTIIAMLVFYPVFYGIVEFVLFAIPTPAKEMLASETEETVE